MGYGLWVVGHGIRLLMRLVSDAELKTHPSIPHPHRKKFPRLEKGPGELQSPAVGERPRVRSHAPSFRLWKVDVDVEVAGQELAAAPRLAESPNAFDVIDVVQEGTAAVLRPGVVRDRDSRVDPEVRKQSRDEKPPARNGQKLRERGLVSRKE